MKVMRPFACLLLVFSTYALLPAGLQAATFKVGLGKSFATPCAAIAAAAAGDTIQIDPAGKNSQGKAIWVVSGNDTTVENIEFTGATVVDLNGAGIRTEGSNLTIRYCYLFPLSRLLLF